MGKLILIRCSCFSLFIFILVIVGFVCQYKQLAEKTISKEPK